MGNRFKLFAGIALGSRTRAQCASVAERLQKSGVPARFEAAEKLHITLAFLGWVDPPQVDPIRETLRGVAAGTAPFPLALDKLGAFPNERNPHVVWIGAREAGDAFRELARNVRSAYAQLGFPFEKPAVAHVTIARIKEPRAHVPLVEFAPIRFEITALTLFESLPDARTTRYEVRDQAELKTLP